MRLKPLATPHLLLCAACAEPLSVYDLMARARPTLDPGAAREAVHRLTRAGYLNTARPGRPGRGQHYTLYTLTPAGETALDQLEAQP